MARGMSMTSPEYDVVQKYTDELISLFSRDTASCSNVMLAKGIISSTVHKETRSVAASKASKRLVSAVTANIQGNPQVFQDLVDFMEGEQRLKQTAKKLQEELRIHEDRKKEHQSKYTVEMQQQFTLLVSNIFKSALEQKSSEALCESLLTLAAFEKSTSEESLLKECLHELKHACSCEGIIEIVKPFMSFFNPELVEHVVMSVGKSMDQNSFKHYMKTLGHFCKRFTVIPCVFSTPHAVGGFQELSIQFKSAQRHLKHIRDIKTPLAKILNLNVATLQILSQKEPQVILCLLPCFVCERIFPLSNEQQIELQDIGIVSIECSADKCKVVSESCSVVQEREEQVIELPGLHRPFALGMFYDCRNDNILRGVNICNGAIPDSYVETEDSQTSNSVPIPGDSLEDKAFHLGLNSELKLSLMAGLVQDFSGSAKYWNDRTPSRRVVRVCLKYECTTCVSQLALEKLGDVQHPSFDRVTHVVMRILYGSDVFFVFDYALQTRENYDFVHAKMVEMVKNFSCLNESCDNSFIEAMLSDAGNVKCRIYSVSPNSTRNSCTLREAVDTYIKLLTQTSETRAPNKVWLYPLSKLGNKHNVVVRPVSVGLVNELQAAFEYLHNLTIQAYDMISKHNSILSKFHYLEERLSKFAQLIETFRDEMRKQVGTMLPGIRERKKEEVGLANIVEKSRISPFNLHNLSSFLEQKDEEINRLQILYQNVEDMEFASSRDLESIITAFDIDYVVCLAFNLGFNDEPVLMNMQSFLEKRETGDSSSQPWYSNTKLIEAMLHRIEQFKTFAKVNEERKAVRFIVTNASHRKGEIGSILLYEGKESSIWEPPGAPGKPTISDITPDTVLLEWPKPQYGYESVQCYEISYYSPNSTKESINRESTNSCQESAIVSGLKSKTEYLFKVHPVCNCGIGSSSESSDPITTLEPSSEAEESTTDQVKTRIDSVKPTASFVTHNSIQLNWTTPECGCDNIDNYTVFYRPAENPNLKWKKKYTNGIETTMSVNDLSPETKYVFKVRPELDGGGVGIESELSDHIMTEAVDKPRHVKPMASHITHNSIQLNWAKRECENDEIEGYIVYYREDGSNAKWKKVRIENEEETVNITGLSPETKYVFKVRPELNDGVGTESELSDPICTMSCKPRPGKPTASNITHNSIQLNWSKPEYGNGEIEGYVVYYREDGSNAKWKKVRIENEEETVNITGLFPETKYVFKVRPELNDGVGTESELSDPIITEALVCKPRPEKPTASRITHNSIQLNWTKPEYESDEIEGYIVCYREDGTNAKWKKVRIENEKETVNITGLSPETKYVFKVQPELNEGVGTDSELSDPIITNALTCQPGKPNISNVTHNSVYLTWTKPKFACDKVEYYTIQYKPVDDSNSKWLRKLTESTEETMAITGLSPETKYVFKVRPELNDDVGTESELSDPIITKATSAPEKPVAISVAYDSVTLKWHKPEFGSENIISYNIIYRSIEGSQESVIEVDAQEEIAVVSGLLSRTKYVFKLQPKGKISNGSVSEPSDAIETKATSAPGKPEVSSMEYNSIELKWTKPEIGHDRIKLYTVYAYVISNSDETNLIFRSDGLQERVKVKPLNINTGYSFKVIPDCGEAGVGTESEITDTIYTNATSPAGKPYATSVTHDSIEINWNKPDHGSEHVCSYTVFYKSPTDPQSKWQSMKASNLSLSVAITGLQCCSSYIFKVQPESRDCVKCTESEVTQPIKTKATSPPGNPFAISDTTHNSVNLKWKEPEYGAKNIMYYTILYQSTNKLDHEWQEVKATRMTYHEIKDLIPNTKYIFKVQAICNCGDGSVSESSTVVETKPVCKPGKPTATSIMTHNSIQITWNKPKHFHQHVDFYDVYYRKANDQSGKWQDLDDKISAKNQNCGIKKLDHNSGYIFKVVPVLKDIAKSFAIVAVDSEESDIIWTNATSPPTQLRSSSVTYNSVELEWNKPDLGAENIKNYSVTVYEHTSNSIVKTICTKSVQTKALVTELKAETEYVFKVQPNCEHGTSCKSELSNPIKTDGICKPGVPMATFVAHDTVKLCWDKPQHYSSSVQYYTVLHRLHNDPPNKWNGSTHNFTGCSGIVSNLNPNTSYIFKVHPECLNRVAGIEDSVSKCILTKLTSAPDKPILSAVQHNSIEIKWSKPSIGYDTIKHYTCIVFIEGSDTPQMTLNTEGPKESILVKELKIRTGYKFKICPKCGVDNDGSDSEFSDTIFTKATSPPSKPTAYTVAHDRIQIKWTKPKHGTENISSYMVHYRDENEQQWNQVEMNADGSQILYCSVENISPKTKYHFMVRPTCDFGVGTDSEYSDLIETKATSPPSKPQASDVTHDSLTLKWGKPKIGTESINQYRILYRQANGQWTPYLCSAKTQIIVSGLLINTQYEFKVLPVCAAGEGSESEKSSLVRTKATSPPGKPTLSDVTHDSITLTWTKPEYGYENVKGYTIFRCLLRDPKKEWISVTIDNAHEKIVIRSLETKEYYVFKVLSKCHLCEGSESEESNPIETKAACKVSNIKATVTHNSIQLKWDKPEYFSGKVQSYTISYRVGKFSLQWHALDTNCPDETHTLTSLKPKHTYTIKIIPKCSGDSITTVETLAGNFETKDKPLAERMQDKWSKSTNPVRAGKLAVYKVPVKEDMKSDMIAKCSVGDRQRGVRERVLMLVGATGAGKSTLINSIVNYIYDVHWEHKFRFKLITEESKSQAESQTSLITAYTFYPMDGSPLDYTLTVVDTPGFGDTRGIQRDKEITRQIKEFFSVKPPNGIDQIHMIGFVAQAALARLTPTQKYVFDSILAMFGKDIANNICLMSTFADGQKPQVLEAIKAANIECCHTFKFNNSAVFAEPNVNQFDKLFWEMNRDNLHNFFQALDTSAPQTLQLTKQVLETREQLEINVQGLRAQISAGLGLIQELQQEEKIIEQHGKDLTNMKGYTYEVEVSRTEEIPLPPGVFVTNCKSCIMTCHFPCTISDDSVKYKCAAMEGNYFTRTKKSKCTICPRKCSWEEHVNKKFRYEVRRVVEERTFEDLIKRYVKDGQSDEEGVAEQMKSEVGSQLHDLTSHVFELIRKTRQCVQQLDKIALRPSPLNEVSYIDLMIESEKREANEGLQQRIATLEELKEQAKLLSEATDISGDDQLKGNESTTPWWKFWERQQRPSMKGKAHIV